MLRPPRFAARLLACSCALSCLAIVGCDSADREAAAQAPAQPAAKPVERAVAVLHATEGSGVSGKVYFTKQGDVVHITGAVKGLKPGQKHAIHVHEFGDLSDHAAGSSAGGHYNPTNQKHGRPEDEERHVGDLGNLQANGDGVATLDMRDRVIQLDGPHSIIGRGLVVHAGEDKFTQPVGDAGARAAVGVIGIAQPPQ
ncbi:MAG: superoxide dismutase family protein [Planctomycetaceae bacterium]